MNFAVVIFGFIFAAGREISEHAKEGRFTGWGDWWNTPKSFTNKTKWGEALKLPKWVFNTVMVWTTDAEHFFQMLSFIEAIIAVYYGGNWKDAALFYIGAQLFGALKPLTNLR